MLSHFHYMARYNRWMNQRIHECCASLSDEERKRDMGAFFRSIHGTLNHLLLADRVWMGRFTQRPFEIESLDQELYADFSILWTERKEEDARILEWVNSLSSETLARELVYTSIVGSQTRRYPFWFALAHFFNHQTHHRGQVTTLLSQQGIDPGVTDLIGLPELMER
ncbi:DinB family protein [Aidingimonas lacisalsi]|uniref:DinB family protein n=1 Tax=Aidingimonas lacisalsi TaxID=2604086 RepID=UPI0011D2756B|nr:DinB family protein [Aidingimonas lacisalsi]